MSSKAKRVSNQIIQQRITTVVQVLSIMSSEAQKMSWFQRFRISQSFLWKKNIDCFFELASKNKKKEEKEKKKEEEKKEEKKREKREKRDKEV